LLGFAHSSTESTVTPTNTIALRECGLVPPSGGFECERAHNERVCVRKRPLFAPFSPALLPRRRPCTCEYGRTAERGGFEPPNEVNPRYAISSRARSTAPAPLRSASSQDCASALSVPGSDLPGAAAQQRHLVARTGDARHRHLVGADHEV